MAAEMIRGRVSEIAPFTISSCCAWRRADSSSLTGAGGAADPSGLGPCSCCWLAALMRSSSVFCHFSTSFILLLPLLAALMPFPAMSTLAAAASTRLRARAAWPSRPRKEVAKPMYSSASRDRAEPMMSRKAGPKSSLPVRMRCASLVISALKASSSTFPSALGAILRARKTATSYSLLLCLISMRSLSPSSSSTIPSSSPCCFLNASSTVPPSVAM
mmetsp:Transcript_6416/g.12245  ORF Transcript_6416/g.12245 Transcript_6416/m.12245 type:complete len:217 (+) Transcript_6416:2690-3340(+)